jgi:serine/threonine protein kinase
MIVGFDGSFYPGRPPAPENIQPTPEYNSPEVAAYLSEKDPAIGSGISSASDVYSVALLFYLYQTGKQLLPKKDTAYDYPYQANFGDLDVSAASGYGKFLALLEKMMAPKAGDRPESKDLPAMLDKLKG